MTKRRTFLTLSAGLAAVALMGAAGCSRGLPGSGPKIMSITEVHKIMVSKHPPKLFDANGESTRKKFGVIPGARLLNSESKFVAGGALPKDTSKGLIFYCANTRCSAAESAAKKAMAAGFKDVSVMPEGIMGWSKAGKPIRKLKGS